MNSPSQERAADTEDRTAADTATDAEGGGAADETMKEGAADAKKEKRSGGTDRQSQATMLAAIAMGDDVELFRTPEGDAYADIRIDGHRETWKVNSKGSSIGCAAPTSRGRALQWNDATASALDIVEAQAQFGGTVREVHLRVAEHDGRIYINLANAKWQAVEIAPGAWRVIDEPPVRFATLASVARRLNRTPATLRPGRTAASSCSPYRQQAPIPARAGGRRLAPQDADAQGRQWQ
jgi:hypothetical protein